MEMNSISCYLQEADFSLKEFTLYELFNNERSI